MSKPYRWLSRLARSSAIPVLCALLMLSPGGAQAQLGPTSSPSPSASETPSGTPSTSGSPAASASPAGPSPTPVAVPLGEVSAQTETVTGTLRDMETGLSTDPVFSSIKADLPDTNKQISTRLEETSKLLAAHASLDSLRSLENDWRSLGKTVATWKSQLLAQATSLDGQIDQLGRLKQTWDQTLQDTRGANVPTDFRDKVESLIAQIRLTRLHVETRRSQVLRLQDQVADADGRVARGLDEVVSAHQLMVQKLVEQDSPPIWSSEIISQFGVPMLNKIRLSMDTQVASLRDYVEHNYTKALLHLVLFGVLVLGLRWVEEKVRPWVKADSNLLAATRVFDTPISSGLVISVFFSHWIYGQAPRLLLALLGAAALLPTVLILRRLILPRFFPLLNALMAFYVMDQMRGIAASLPVVARLLFCTEMLGGCFFVVWFMRSQARLKEDINWTGRALYRVTLTLFLGALLVSVLGYVNLANLVGNAVLSATYLAVIFAAMLRIGDGLILFALRVKPFTLLHFVRNHRPLLRRRLRQGLRVLVYGLWILTTFDRLSLQTPFVEWLKTWLTADIGFGALKVSLGDLVAFVITIWASFFISRVLRFLLDEDVYPRLSLGRGLPYAITTMLHYTVLLVGFFTALAALGIDTTKFAVLAGAFGVGLGFGLQNIVSNFVSGLILLFERPVKVGDIIQFGTFQGNLSQIGLRASVLRIADGSEVIVPNAQLISEKVTNWTLTDQQRRVEVLFGVAYGSNPEQVQELLQAMSLAHPDILDTPAPEVLFMDFAESSLNFRLQAWTVNPAWMRVRSQLMVKMNSVLQEAGISMPFPQREVMVQWSLPAELEPLVELASRSVSAPGIKEGEPRRHNDSSDNIATSPKDV